VIRTTLTAWLASLVTLLVAAAGLFAVSATSTTTSTTQMALAAGVLGALAAVAGLVVTPAADRVLGRRVLWGGAVPLACGAGTAALVAAATGWDQGLLAGLPWPLGAAVVCAAGARLPDLRVLGGGAALRRWRERPRRLPDLGRR